MCVTGFAVATEADAMIAYVNRGDAARAKPGRRAGAPSACCARLCVPYPPQCRLCAFTLAGRAREAKLMERLPEVSWLAQITQWVQTNKAFEFVESYGFKKTVVKPFVERMQREFNTFNSNLKKRKRDS
jgi:hypothetical protein